MKNNLFIATTLLLAVSLTGCSNDEGESLKSEDFKVYASMDNQSRTALDNSGSTVVWSEGDQIYLFGGNSNATMTLVSGAGQTNATFRGGVNGYPSELEKALYPVPSIDGNAFAYEFPAEIAYSKNSNAPMLGGVEGNGQIRFRYLTPLVRIPLVNLDSSFEHILTLEMRGITGTATVNLEEGKLDFADGATRGNTVTVTIPTGMTQCYVDIPVPAGTYDGYKVTLDNAVLKSSVEARTLGVNDAFIIGDARPTEYVAFSTEILESDVDIDVDYAILGSNGLGYLYEFRDNAPQLPQRVTVWDGSQEDIPDSSAELVVSFDDSGLPTTICHPDFTIVIANHNENKFDAFITTTAGESAIFEDVELQDDMTWEKYLQGLEQQQSRAGFRPSIGTVNTVVGLVGCGLSVAATIASAPTGVGAVVGWGLTAISCGSAIQTLMDNAGWIDTPDGLSGVSTTLAGVAAIVSCVNPSNPVGVASCIAGALGTVVGIIDIILDNRQDDINLGNGALMSGNGDVKFTLTWDKPSDIDLHCVDAEGYHIYYANKKPLGSKGYLDFDNIPGFPTCTDPENIYFAAPAPSGQYEVYLHYFSDHNNQGPVNYTVLVMINGEGQTYRGTINQVGDNVPIITFNYGTPESRALPEFRPIPWDWNNLPSKF